jgi:hypothetical protein
LWPRDCEELKAHGYIDGSSGDWEELKTLGYFDGSSALTKSRKMFLLGCFFPLFFSFFHFFWVLSPSLVEAKQI